MTPNSNVAEFVRNSARNYPTQVAVIDSDRILTWAELDSQIDAFACGLIQRGLHAGERVKWFCFIACGNEWPRTCGH